jgi:putative ABC transport system permease protein
LLVSSTLTIRSFMALQKIDLGFQPDRVLTVGLPLPPKRYATLEQRNRFARDLLERVKHLPGVTATSIGNGGMPFGGLQSNYSIDGQTEPETRRMNINMVAADYLETLGIAVQQGRMLSEQEVNNAERVAVINEAASKLLPEGENPIGRRIRLNELEKPGQPSILVQENASPYVTIVGVMKNTRNDDLRTETQPVILLPYTLMAPPGRTLAIRTQNDPKLIMNSLRSQVAEMDSEQPVSNPFTVEEILGFRTAQPRFTMVLFSLFAALGLMLALAGIYSVLSYLVTMRTRELGVRMALGARPRDILRLILQAGGKLVGIGLVIGIFASFIAARLLGNQLNLFQVTNTDPLSFALVVALLGVVAAFACLIPARRATKVDPMTALRHD